MKKILLSLMAILILLTGCNKKEDNENKNNQKDNNVVEPKDKIEIELNFDDQNTINMDVLEIKIPEGYTANVKEEKDSEYFTLSNDRIKYKVVLDGTALNDYIEDDYSLLKDSLEEDGYTLNENNLYDYGDVKVLVNKVTSKKDNTERYLVITEVYESNVFYAYVDVTDEYSKMDADTLALIVKNVTVL